MINIFSCWYCWYVALDFYSFTLCRKLLFILFDIHVYYYFLGIKWRFFVTINFCSMYYIHDVLQNFCIHTFQPYQTVIVIVDVAIHFLWLIFSDTLSFLLTQVSVFIMNILLTTIRVSTTFCHIACICNYNICTLLFQSS